MNTEWLEKFEPLCMRLLELGWFVPPFITGHDFEKLETVCDKIQIEEDTKEQDKKNLEREIDFVLSDIAFHPNFRAFFVYRTLELEHFSEFSHLYEQAVLCYYKREYHAAIMTLLPALEGILLLYSGWKFDAGNRKPSPKKLINKIIESQLNSDHENLNKAFKMYKRIFTSFLEKWIYQDTSTADLSLSFLNRHLLLHGMHPKANCRPEDAYRLILLFDLVTEYFSLIEEKYFDFIPEDKIEINLRRSYYSQLAEGDITINQSWEFEREFLSQHKNFDEHINVPSFQKSQMREIIEMMNMLSTISKNKAK